MRAWRAGMVSGMANDMAVVSFFSGAMGLDLGLIRAGLDVVVCQELEPRACETIRGNGHKVVEGDLREIMAFDPGLRQLREFLDNDDDEVFAVVGGPPCQSFSTAGKRGGVGDSRGMLIFDYLKAAKSLEPRFIVLENVKGLVSSPGIAHESLLDDILLEFAAMGYSATSGVVDAVSYGASQFRERLLIIASRDAEAIFLPNATHFQRHQNKNYRWRTLRDTISDLEHEPGECASFSTRISDTLRHVPEGGNWRSLPADLAESAMGGAWGSGGGKVGFFRRLSYSEPCPTLVTSPVQKATLLAHPNGRRPLSVAEYARIQGFPDEHVFFGRTADKYKQIGNAVPLPLGAAIGEALLSLADGSSMIHTKRRRCTSTHDRAEELLMSHA